MPVFNYKAVQLNGKTRQGQIIAANEADAFGKLRYDNLSPLSLKQQQNAISHTKKSWSRILPGIKGMSENDIEAMLGSLAVLLRAGADIRTALGVLSDDNSALKSVTQKVLSGASVEASLAPLFAGKNAHIGALIAAGEVRGDLPSGLEAAANVIATRRLIRDQMVEALSYPAFVFITAIAALMVILLVVVPAIAPLLEGSGQTMPIYFRVIVWLSKVLQVTWLWLLLGVLTFVALFIITYMYGGLKRHVEAWMIDGPLGGIVCSVMYGGYAKTLGDMLMRGAGLTEGLRLCNKSIGNIIARERLDAVGNAVRQGRLLSEALLLVRGFPRAIIKLAEVGEASSALGAMLARAGEREQAAALKHITRLSKLLGPMLIMTLGAMIGLIMGGVLTALTDIGSIAGG